MVERYSPIWENDIEEVSGGDYVSYSDYAALEAENTRMKEALKKCYCSLCAYVDRDYREGGPLSAYDAEGAIAKGRIVIAKAREVLGDA